MKRIITFEDFKNDSRFYIDDFNAKRIFDNNIKRVKVVNIKLKKINMFIDGKYIFLPYFPVYNAFNENEEFIKEYELYCIKYRNENINPNRNVEGLKKLKEEMNNQEYNIKKGAIVLNEFNSLLDGQHRCCILFRRYGENKKVSVVKVLHKNSSILIKFKTLIYLFLIRIGILKQRP